MKLSELQNYKCWIDKTPHEIFFAAKAYGGWKCVFPQGRPFPVWASKVRNYFNTLPTTLTRLPETNARHLLDRPQFLPFLVRARNDSWANRTYRDYRRKPWGYDPPPFKPHPRAPAKIPEHIMKMSEKEAIAQQTALSGDVYLDNLNRPWFQMAAGSTIYHWGDHPDSPTAEAIYQDVIMRQNDTPVFKLICPDDNGGSCEVIIHNAEIRNGPYNNRSKAIGEVGKKIIVKGGHHRGSDPAGLIQLLRDDDPGIGRTRKVRCQAARSQLIFLCEPARSVRRSCGTEVSGARPGEKASCGASLEWGHSERSGDLRCG